MANPPQRHSPDAPPYDELEAMLEIDRSMDDIFNDFRNTTENTSNDKRVFKEVTYGGNRKDQMVGVDDEIKLGSKKRKPVAKLDEARLLSPAGIPKLQKMAKTRFKFRGKGHEFSDVLHLLRMYQLWLDDLYPRAKFVDGLTIIEKLGHSKRMQVRRKGWIDEGKMKTLEDADNAGLDTGLPAEARIRDELYDADGVELAGKPVPGSASRPGAGENENALGLRSKDPVPEDVDPSSRTDGPGEPDHDELDALLAEQSAGLGNSNEIAPDKAAHRPPSAVEPSFDDDEDAMRELGGMNDLW